MSYRVEKTDEQWREELSDVEYAVMRKAATEPPFTGALLDEHRDGVFVCKACGADLFTSTTKFESGSGWPSFYEPITGAVHLKEDSSWFMTRTEVLCATCGSHLGHLFEDAPQTPTGARYCMNSISLQFKPEG